MAIYVRNKEGDLTPLNIPAIKGKDGINGVDGVTPNIEVGEITTLETGQEVTATIEGSKENPIIKFSIPKGIDGENGEEGNVIIDDNNISEESVWSPDKITGEIKKSNDKIKEIKSKNDDQDNKLKEVERKNELQDFYINGLFNENSHNRMVIEEEGNEIKLEGSKKGFVEVDKIVGNTLVNRVNEPMRELTLNGDIDEKGFSITTNESVENGLVDVVCEGDTLVNCILKNSNYRFVANGDWVIITRRIDDCVLKPATKYTLIVYIKENTLNQNGEFHLNTLAVYNQVAFKEHIKVPNTTTGIYKTTLTTKEDIRECTLSFRNQLTPSCTSGVLEYDLVLLEGDYMDKPIPTEYFEGIKSVGEQADGTHKIEVVTNNKNLLNLNKYNRTVGGVSLKSSSTDNNVIIINGTYNSPNFSFSDFYLHGRWDGSDSICTLRKGKSYSCLNTSIEGIEAYYISGTESQKYNTGILSKDIPITGVMIRVHENKTFDNIEIKLQIEESSINTSYVPHTSNKKEFSLKEPLRGLPNGVKDKPVKIDGKWFIERNCKEIILDGNNNQWYLHSGQNADPDYKTLYFALPVNDVSFDHNPISDKFTGTVIWNKDIEGIWVGGSNDLNIRIKKTRLSKPDLPSFIKWLQDNPVKAVYQLSKPIYEPLETTPELVCYDEVTHITNNSMIPCNMVVKNTGFSCMSLLKDRSYTAVHNGDKGVTAKVDIADNMVRLYGKGKTVSDVTVVDGNVSKLHYTFKGMKSSFEDKLVTQEMVEKGLEKAENLGKYRVDVKVTGKNLVNPSKCQLNFFYDGDYAGIEKGDHLCFESEVKSYKSYVLNNRNVYAVLLDDNRKLIPDGVKKTDTGKGTLFILNTCGILLVRTTGKLSTGDSGYNSLDDFISSIQLEEGTVTSQYEPYKEYKTSVYLNSPLLKGDEIVMKEDGLYHYHKMWKFVLDKDYDSIKLCGPNYQSERIITFRLTLPKLQSESWIDSSKIICDKIHSKTGVQSAWLGKGEGVTSDKPSLMVSLNRNKLKVQDVDGFKAWLQDNPLTIVYELTEPYYEKISDNNILLDVPNNATLQLDSMLPCQNVKLNYTGKIPNISVMKNNISIIEERNINTIANNFDMDFRLIELEQALKESKLNLTNARKSNNISSNRFQQAKILILANRYNKEKMTYQLSKYLERGYLNQEEFDELIDLMK